MDVEVSVKVLSHYTDVSFNDVMNDLDFKLTGAVWHFANERM